MATYVLFVGFICLLLAYYDLRAVNFYWHKLNNQTKVFKNAFDHMWV